MAHVGFEENIAYRVLNRASSMSRVTFQLVQPFPGCNIRLRYVFPLPSAHPFSQSFAHFEGFVVYSFRLSYLNYRTFAKFLPKFVPLKFILWTIGREKSKWLNKVDNLKSSEETIEFNIWFDFYLFKIWTAFPFFLFFISQRNFWNEKLTNCKGTTWILVYTCQSLES